MSRGIRENPHDPRILEEYLYTTTRQATLCGSVAGQNLCALRYYTGDNSIRGIPEIWVKRQFFYRRVAQPFAVLMFFLSHNETAGAPPLRFLQGWAAMLLVR